MTLTSPNCPVADSLPKMVKENIMSIEGVKKVDLKLVWSPPWTKDMMSEEAKLELNKNEKVIKLTDTAADRIKEIMSNADNKTIGVRVGVKSGGCAGMSYIMEYAKDKKKNDEVIEEKGVKALLDPAAIIYLLGTEWIIRK